MGVLPNLSAPTIGHVGLLTVFAAILSSRQRRVYGNLASNIFNNTLVLKTFWIENFNVTREELNAKTLGM